MCQGGGGGGAGIDSEGVVAGFDNIEADMGEVVVGGEDGGGQLDAPDGGAGVIAEADDVAVGGIAQGVAGEGLEVGREVVGAAVGVEGAGVEPIPIAPSREAAAGSCRGGDGDDVGVGVGEGAATRGGAVAGVVGGGGDCGGGAEAGVGFDAYDGVVVDVVGAGASPTGATGSGVEAADGIVAVAIAIPPPVEVEESAVVESVADKGVSAGRILAIVQHRSAGQQLAGEHGGPTGSGVVGESDLF